MRLKYKNCFSPISYLFIKTITKVLKSQITFDFYHLYGNKNGCQNRPKIGHGPFWSKFEMFDREINIEHKQIPKRYFNRRRELPQHTTYCFFLYLAVLISNFLKIGLEEVKIWSKMAIISLF